ncbi:MAG: hypothetical protein ACHQYQ_00615 [Bacteriovoracales bacterium]
MNWRRLGLILIVLASCVRESREESIRLVSEMVRPWEEREWRKVGWQDSEFEYAKFHDIKFDMNFARKEEDKFKTCVDYGEGSGCLFVVLARVGKVKFSMARFDKEGKAKKMAFIMREYYFGRWVMDGVAGEPTLVDFVKEVFKAQKVDKFP